jgi:hypothetical protein
VPELTTVPELTARVAKLSGWPSLSVRFTLSHQDQSPARLPSDALACQARKVSRWPCISNGWTT